jgi:hypothetical protein
MLADNAYWEKSVMLSIVQIDIISVETHIL